MDQIEEWTHQLRLREAQKEKKDGIERQKTYPIGISLMWIIDFLKRTPSIHLAPARVLEEERSANSTKQELDRYFDLLVGLVAKHKYDLSMIANFDETYLVWGCNRWKVVTRSTNKSGMLKEMNLSEHVTLCQTIFADGTTIPSLVILPKVYMPNELDYKKFPSFDWTGQKNGWIDKAIFEQYCLEVLIPQFERRAKELPRGNRQGLLILDGHNSRANSKVIKVFKEANIDVLVLPAHTSHITQPLDLCFFCIFKRRLHPLPGYKGASTAAEKRVALLTAAQFAVQQASATYYIDKSFYRAGISPLNRAKLMDSDCIIKSPPSAFPLPPTTPKKPSGRININCSILTDRIEELEEWERKRDSSSPKTPNPKKRSNTVETTDAAPQAKRITTVAAPVEVSEPMEIDEFVKASPTKPCCLCLSPPVSTAARWTQCEICEDEWVCRKHTTGLLEHYKKEHPDDEVPGRKHRKSFNRRMDDYLMDFDEE